MVILRAGESLCTGKWRDQCSRQHRRWPARSSRNSPRPWPSPQVGNYGIFRSIFQTWNWCANLVAAEWGSPYFIRKLHGERLLLIIVTITRKNMGGNWYNISPKMTICYRSLGKDMPLVLFILKKVQLLLWKRCNCYSEKGATVTFSDSIRVTVTFIIWDELLFLFEI